MSPWWHLNLCPHDGFQWHALAPTSDLSLHEQAMQEVEPGAGWYLPVGQETHATPKTSEDLPAKQAVQVEEAGLDVNWPAGHSRQEVEAGAAWYVEAGHATHSAGAHSLKPAQLAPC